MTVALTKTPAQVYVTGSKVKKAEVITLEGEIISSIVSLQSQVTAAANGRKTGAVRAATVDALPAHVYANGASGVGATMEASVNGAFPEVDGVALIVGDDFWYLDPATPPTPSIQFGKWTLTDAGSVGSKWLATRTTDTDTAAELGYAMAFVTEGDTLGGFTIQVPTAPADLVIGTTAIAPVIVDGPNGSAGLLDAIDRITLRLSIVGGDENNFICTASPTQTAYTEKPLFLIIPTAKNTGDCTLKVDGLDEIPLLAEDMTAIDDGALLPIPYLCAYVEGEIPYARIVSPPVSRGSMKRLGIPASVISTSDISSPETRYVETNVTQTGFTMEMVGGDYNKYFGHGFPVTSIAGSPVIVEFKMLASNSVEDGFAIIMNPAPFTEAGQFLDDAAVAFVMRRDGSLVFYNMDNSTPAGGDFSGQNAPEIQRYAVNDVVRIIMSPSPNGSGGIMNIFKNGDHVKKASWPDTLAWGGQLFAGLKGVAAGCKVQVNFASVRVMEPGSAKTVFISNQKSEEGNGTSQLPYKTQANALRCSEYTAESMEYHFLDGAPHVGSGGCLPIYKSLTLIGCGNTPTEIWGGVKLAAGSASFTKIGGKVHLYKKAQVFNGITNCKAPASSGFIVLGVSQDVGLAGKGYTIPNFLCRGLAPDFDQTAMDSMPGTFTVITATGEIVIHCPGGVDPDTLNIIEIQSDNVWSMPYGGAFWDLMTFRTVNIDFDYSNSSAVAAARVYVDSQSSGANYSLGAYGWGLDTCPGRMFGPRAVGNGADGLNTVGVTGVAAEPNRYYKLEIFDPYFFGNSILLAGDGMSAHDHCWLVAHGGRCNANGKGGIASFFTDAYGVECKGNVTAGININAGQNLFVVANISGCKLSDNLWGLWANSPAGMTVGGLTVEVYGGTECFGNTDANQQVTGHGEGHDPVVNSSALFSGAKPTDGDNFIEGGGTINQRAPSYVARV